MYLKIRDLVLSFKIISKLLKWVIQNSYDATYSSYSVTSSNVQKSELVGQMS